MTHALPDHIAERLIDNGRNTKDTTVDSHLMTVYVYLNGSQLGDPMDIPRGTSLLAVNVGTRGAVSKTGRISDTATVEVYPFGVFGSGGTVTSTSNATVDDEH